MTDEKDSAALDEATRGFELSAGSWVAAGFAFDGTGPAGFFRAGVRDPETLDRAMKELVALAGRAAPVEPVRGRTVRIAAGKTVLENIPGDVYRLRLSLGRPPGGTAAAPPASPTDTPAAVDVLFRRLGDVLYAATGYASRDALRALLAATSEDNLALVPEVAGPLGRAGSDVLLAGFVDPGRITASLAGKPGSVGAAPVVASVRRETGGDGVTLHVAIEGTSTAVAELSRWLSP
ncbi:MAG: hypothetical protein R3B70_10880 [Polyangiaceae bacterium]